jgi:hypothetical protein
MNTPTKLTYSACTETELKDWRKAVYDKIATVKPGNRYAELTDAGESYTYKVIAVEPDDDCWTRVLCEKTNTDMLVPTLWLTELFPLV